MRWMSDVSTLIFECFIALANCISNNLPDQVNKQVETSCVFAVPPFKTFLFLSRYVFEWFLFYFDELQQKINVIVYHGCLWNHLWGFFFLRYFVSSVLQNPFSLSYNKLINDIWYLKENQKAVIRICLISLSSCNYFESVLKGTLNY